MNADIMAEWLRRQGHHVIRTPSTYWHSQGLRVYQAFPYHWLVGPSESELHSLLRDHKAIGLRYSAPYTASPGHVSYHAIYDGKEYLFEDLSKKARYDVRKGLANATVEPVSFSRLAKEGWPVRAETLARQGRAAAETEASWHRLCASADGLPGFESWGALVDDQLAACLIAFTCDDCCLILYQQSRTGFLTQGVNNALTGTFTQQAITRPHVRRVFYGLHSLDASEGVDQYKFRMAYQAKLVRQRVLFHPWLIPLFNGASYALVRRAARRWSSQPRLSKAEGMMRFYLEGLRPLAEQTWPEVLNDRKDAILQVASHDQTNHQTSLS